jgi:hypothetical protein
MKLSAWAQASLWWATWFVGIGLAAVSFPSQAQDYKYNPANKVDPFQSITLRKPNIRGLSRLQDYDLSQLELVGTLVGEEISALILTPEPREGILAKIGDRAGRKGGRIIAISRNKVVVREPTQGIIVPGKNQKFVDVVMLLASRTAESLVKPLTSAADSRLGFPGIEVQNAPSPMGEGRPPPPTFLGAPPSALPTPPTSR